MVIFICGSSVPKTHEKSDDTEIVDLVTDRVLSVSYLWSTYLFTYRERWNGGKVRFETEVETTEYRCTTDDERSVVQVQVPFFFNPFSSRSVYPGEIVYSFWKSPQGSTEIKYR